MMIDSAAPRLVTVPEGVTFAEAEQAIALCTRLGLLKPLPGGWILGVVSPGEGVLDLTPDQSVLAPAHLVEAFEDAPLHRPPPPQGVTDYPTQEHLAKDTVVAALHALALAPNPPPEVQVARGGIRLPASAHASAGVGSPDDDGPPVAPHLSSTGWCAPSDFISNITISPEDAARIEYELRPCGGEHRWERWVSSSQCGCSQCDYTEQYVECAGCPAVVREGERGFDELWEAAPWG